MNSLRSPHDPPENRIGSNFKLFFVIPSISRNIQSCTSRSNRVFNHLPKVKALRSLLSDLGASCILDAALGWLPPSEGLDKNSRDESRMMIFSPQKKWSEDVNVIPDVRFKHD